MIQKKGHEIANHGLSHQDLTILSYHQIENEIKKNHQELLENLDINCSSFSYPYGYVNSTVVKILKKNGYKQAFGQHSGIYTSSLDPFYIPRFSTTALKDKITNFNEGIKIISIRPQYTIRENPCEIVITFEENDKINYIDYIHQNGKKIKYQLVKNKNIMKIKFLERLKEKKTTKNDIRLTFYSKDYKKRWGYFFNFKERFLWYNQSNIINNFELLPIGYRTNNWFIIVKTLIPWKGKIKEPNNFDQVEYFDKKKQKQIIIEVFKSPFFGLRAGMMNILKIAKTTNKKLVISFQNLIDAKYMEDPKGYFNYLKVNNISVTWKFDLRIKNEAMSYFEIILKIELGKGTIDKEYFFDKIPNYEKTLFLEKGYELTIDVYKEKYKFLFEN
jgi:hypothetical protein